LKKKRKIAKEDVSNKLDTLKIVSDYVIAENKLKDELKQKERSSRQATRERILDKIASQKERMFMSVEDINATLNKKAKPDTVAEARASLKKVNLRKKRIPEVVPEFVEIRRIKDENVLMAGEDKNVGKKKKNLSKKIVGSIINDVLKFDVPKKIEENKKEKFKKMAIKRKVAFPKK
jgi:hypothetical protein